MATNRAAQVTGGAGRQSNRGLGSRGASLLEALIAMLVVTIVVGGLLQFTGYVLVSYERNQAESKKALERWNASRTLRMSHPDSDQKLEPVAGARPLHRFILESGANEWEVLCAEK